MNKTECKTYFEITGNFDVEEITNIIGIKNTSGHAIGDRKNSNGNFMRASWIYGTEYEETLESSKQVNKVITPLLSKIKELNYIYENYNCTFVLEQVQNIYNNEKPGIFYDNRVIDFCAQTKTVIDVDIYIY